MAAEPGFNGGLSRIRSKHIDAIGLALRNNGIVAFIVTPQGDRIGPGFQKVKALTARCAGIDHYAAFLNKKIIIPVVVYDVFILGYTRTVFALSFGVSDFPVGQKVKIAVLTVPVNAVFLQ